jgi:hypothetical protein
VPSAGGALRGSSKGVEQKDFLAFLLQMLGDQLAQVSHELGRRLDDQATLTGPGRREIFRVQG